MTVTTDTPGYTASILAGDSATRAVHRGLGVAHGRGDDDVRPPGPTARYYVVWITNLGAHQSVHVNEVRATR